MMHGQKNIKLCVIYF